MPHSRTTLADVAAAAGVSKAAVSRVINDAPGVSARTRDHVREVIARLGYRPDPVARALASGHGDVVELVVVDDPSLYSTNPYYGRVTAGILQELAGGNAHLRVHVIDEAGAPALLTRIADTVSLGIVTIDIAPELAAEIDARCHKLVSLTPSATGVPFVGTENEQGAYAAVRHLHDTGRRHIAAVHGPEGNPCAEARREGHRRAVQDLGLPDRFARGKFCRPAGYALTERILAEDPSLDALFVACDLMASGALQALAAAGRSVPGDVALVGYDDSLIATCATPPMSSVRQPVEQMAAAATRALVDGGLAPHWRRVFPAELRVRQSSAAAV
jgi:DNA-binding LacI/PurR family transcriptional regulator